MTSPKTPQELADTIEAAVASYLNEVRLTVQQAVDRTLSKSGMTTRAAKAKSARSAQQPPATRRRSVGELEELCDRLHRCVCARPGESMAVFANEVGIEVRQLQRPMSKLKAEGRIRSVGQRNTTRYFPAVARAARSAG